MPNSEEKFLYGCVFCRTGQEKVVAELLERKYEGLKATAVYQIKHKSVQGRKTTEQVVVFPGYVFFIQRLKMRSFRILAICRASSACSKDRRGDGRCLGKILNLRHGCLNRAG